MKDELEHLVDEGWQLRCGGDGSELHGRVITPDALMVLANGQAMTRDEVVAALRDTPPSASCEIRDLRQVSHGADAAALVHVGIAHRGAGPSVVAMATITHARLDGQWRWSVNSQAPVPDATTSA
jgi:hypothetical protein